MPVRADNLMSKICSMENLELALKNASKGKKCKRAIAKVVAHKEEMLGALQKSLLDGTYQTSPYHHKQVYDPKERTISILPFFPDRIAQHAIIRVIEPIIVSKFIPQTYACIKGRGIHAGVRAIHKAFSQDIVGTRCCLKIDIRHYYPSIEHDRMKAKVRRMIKDPRLLIVLDNIIDSEEGLPIGNYSSQYLANIYLNDFDHWCKEVLKIKFYFRYVDDIVILSDSKEYLRFVFSKIKMYLCEKMGLEIKDNWQIFPVDDRGLDFLGYVFRHSHTRLRKRVKTKIKRKLNHLLDKELTPMQIHKEMGSYQGWINYCNGRHFIQTLNDKANGKVFQQGSSRPRRKMGR